MAALLGLMVLAFTAWPAVAHDALVATKPADGAKVEAPTEVVLTFSADQLAVGAAIAVTGPDGDSWTDGPATVVGASVVQPVRDDLLAGDYVVEWRSVSGDGHPVNGTFTFTVEPEPDSTLTPAPTPMDPSEAPPTAESTPVGRDDAAGEDADEGRDSRRGSPWLPVGVVVLAVVAGVTGAVLFVRHRGRQAGANR